MLLALFGAVHAAGSITCSSDARRKAATVSF